MVTTKHNHDRVSSNTDTFFDRDWMKSSFMITDEDAFENDADYSKWIRANRYASTADMKFSSTVPGMSVAVNPKPQFTRYADPRVRGKLHNRPERITTETTGHEFGLGMGRYYSEAIDDNQQRIFMRFGTPQYMSMLLWITASFDVHKAALQNRGQVTSTFLNLVNISSKLMSYYVAPALHISKFVLNLIVQPDRFVSVRDNMITYWATTENILNSFIVRRTMLTHMSSGGGDGTETSEPDDGEEVRKEMEKEIEQKKGIKDIPVTIGSKILEATSARVDNTINQEQRVTKGTLTGITDIIPDLIDNETGRIRVNALALRAQRAYNRMLADDMRRHDELDFSRDFTGYPITGQQGHDTYFTDDRGNVTIFNKFFFGTLYSIFVGEDGKGDSLEDAPKMVSHNPIHTDEDGNPINVDLSGEEDPDIERERAVRENEKKKENKTAALGEYFMASLMEGAAFAVFNVNNTGSIGESFSNSTQSNPIESIFNSVSSKVRGVMNNLAHVTSFPIVGEAMKLAGDTLALGISNASAGLANPLLGLAYGAQISLPKQWESSSANMPNASYSMRLSSPYGNAFSQLFNIYLPLSMLMAASLPRKTGLDSYTAPPLCQLYDRGRVNIPLGIITSFNITRGTSNLAFTRGGHPNAIDVEFTVTDLNEIIALDVTSSSILTKAMEAFSPNLSDDAFTNYANTITGVDVYQMYYKIPAARLKLAERVMAFKAVSSMHPSDLAAFTVNNVPIIGGLGKAIMGHSSGAAAEAMKK